MRTRESDQFKTVLALYEQEIEQFFSKPNYQKWKTVLRSDSKRWKSSSKGNHSEAAVPLERDLEDRAKITSVKIARIRHAILSILQNVNFSKHNRNANSVKNASSGTQRLTPSQTKS